MNHVAVNLRRLRLDKHLTQEQAAQALGVSAQSVSRWETSTTLPDVMLLPDIAKLYGVLVDDLFKPSPKGYANNALRLLAVYERTGSRDDFIAAADEFDRLIRTGAATPDDWRSYGVIHEYMMKHCQQRAIDCYDRAMDMACEDDPPMMHRILRQKLLLRCHIGQGDQCVAEQKAALQAAPEDVQAWIDLAHTQHFAGQCEAALHTCTTAIRRFPEEGLLHVYAGDACRELKRYDEAFPHWEAAIRLDDQFMDALFSTAFCREELGQHAEAAAIWEEIARKLNERGLEIEAQWPREMAEKCRAQIK